MKSIVKKFALVMLLGMTAASSFANQFVPNLYWDKANYGKYSAYSATRLGGWALSGPPITDVVYSGRVMQCPKATGVIDCYQQYAESIWYTFQMAVEVSYKQALIPTIAEVSGAVSWTRSQTRTYTNTFGINIARGYKAQHLEVVPRRAGNATFYGVRVGTGATRKEKNCRVLLVCDSGTQYQYYTDPNKILGVMYAKVNTSPSKLPEATFKVTPI